MQAICFLHTFLAMLHRSMIKKIANRISGPIHKERKRKESFPTNKKEKLYVQLDCQLYIYSRRKAVLLKISAP